MAFAIITREDKFLPYRTKPEADAALEEVQKTYPKAFVAPVPAASTPIDWEVDMDAQTVRVSASKKAAREAVEQARKLGEMFQAAVEAELKVLVENGTTPEAIAYRTARDGG